MSENPSVAISLREMGLHVAEREGYCVVGLERHIKQYVEILVKRGFSHDCIAVRGDLRRQLGQLADLMGIERVLI